MTKLIFRLFQPRVQIQFTIFFKSSLLSLSDLANYLIFLYLSFLVGFPCDSAGKESTCNTGDLASIPGLWRSPGEGKGYPLQYSGLENSMDCIVHGVAKSRTQLRNFHFSFLALKANSSRGWEKPLWRRVRRSTIFFSDLCVYAPVNVKV